MKAGYLLILSLFILSACTTMHNHHPFNAVPLQKKEKVLGLGIGRTNKIFTCGTYSPDSVNVHLQSRRDAIFHDSKSGLPAFWRYGLGQSYSIALQGSYAITGGIHHCGFDETSWADQVQAKAYLSKSFIVAEDLYLAISPAGSFSRGVGVPARSYRIKYSHKSLEIPVTLSYLWQNPFKTSDGYPDLVFSGTLRGARDYFKGDMNRCGPEAFSTIWYYDQPINRVDRYAAMAHLDLGLSPAFKLTAQYGKEYGKSRDYNDSYPIFYGGFEIWLKPINR